MLRYHSLAHHLCQRFGERVQKIPLDAGSTCPNRDGTLSSNGCTFCNPIGSGTGMDASGYNLESQWLHWQVRLKKRYKAKLFLAYLQSFTNTHGPVERLAALLDSLKDLPGLVGLCLGTRPDCLDAKKLDLIAAFPAPEIWLDLGLQSASDATLEAINRGHDSAAFATAVRMAATRGIQVCAHVIAGLPGESRTDFLHTIDFLNNLPVAGIKFHNLYVCRGSTLAKTWKSGDYEPLGFDSYIDWLVRALTQLRPEIVVHRLNGDPRPEELLAPAWAANKNRILHALHSRMEETNIWQGKTFAPEAVKPPRYEADLQTI